MKDFLEHIIFESEKIALEYFNRSGGVQFDRKSYKDIVTEADKAIEDYIVGQINRHFPDHAIIGEETGTHPGNEFCWIIDPIDGTNSFLHHHPFFSTSIAITQNGKAVMGAVNGPVLREYFFAERGKGATLNGQPIRVSTQDSIPDAMMATGFGCLRGDNKHNNMPYFNKMMPLIRGIRRFGSAALDLCYLAAGRFDAYWELHLHIYDVAAGLLIVEEAGGRHSDFAGNQNDSLEEILASNGCLHDQMVKLLSEVKAGLRLEQ